MLLYYYILLYIVGKNEIDFCAPLLDLTSLAYSAMFGRTEPTILPQS